MYRYILPSILLVGCANTTTQADRTRDFLAQEKQLSASCLVGQERMPVPDKLIVNPKTGHSPFYTLANCYSPSLQSIARLSAPEHAPAADQYAFFLLRLAEANDRGAIERSTAAAQYFQATSLFNKAIDQRTVAGATESRKEFFSKLSVFLGSISEGMNEQDRQRAARKPVNCFVNGVYVANSITCM